MTLEERKRMIVGAIEMLKGRLVSLQYLEYDGCLSRQEREVEIERCQRHLCCAHSVLVEITQEELEEVAS